MPSAQRASPPGSSSEPPRDAYASASSCLASHVPLWPGATTKETRAPTAMSREPSAISVQWNGYSAVSSAITSPRPTSLLKRSTFPLWATPIFKTSPAGIQGTILLMGSSIMSEAPASFS